MDEILIQVLTSIERHLVEDDRRIIYEELIPIIYMYDSELIDRLNIQDKYFDECFEQWIHEHQEDLD